MNKYHSLCFAISLFACVNEENRINHEVWLIDQSNSNGLMYGGTIHIYQNPDIESSNIELIDLSEETSKLCFQETGSNPVRPHMVVFNKQETHAILAFVASGHVVIFNADTREPLRCFRTEEGVDNIRQAHAIWPSPDDSYLLVSNQNGKKFEKIYTNYETNTFSQDITATLNLATCTAPSGLPCQYPGLRPDNAPICPFIPTSGFPAYVSLRGGGMLVVDPYTTPMSIISEYDQGTIPRDGCGFIEASGWVYGNGGGANPANQDGWNVYRLPMGGPDIYDPTLPINTPFPQTVSRDDVSRPRDAHGVAKTNDEKYVYFFDRAANLVEQYFASSAEYVETYDLKSEFSLDPTVDLIGESPDGDHFYASMRGPNPLSGDPHASTGTTPGMLILNVDRQGKVTIKDSRFINNFDSSGIQRADAHGIRVRKIQ